MTTFIILIGTVLIIVVGIVFGPKLRGDKL